MMENKRKEVIKNVLVFVAFSAFTVIWNHLVRTYDWLPNPLHNVSVVIMVTLPLISNRITTYATILFKVAFSVLTSIPRLQSHIPAVVEAGVHGITATIIMPAFIIIACEFIFRHFKYHKETNEKLIKAKEEAEKARDAKADFLANMSHEIKTPISGIVGITQMLLADPQAYNKANLRYILESSENLMEIINNILNYSKIESNREEVRYSDFSIEDLLDKIHKSLYGTIQNDSGIELKTKFDPRLPAFVKSDDVRIRQILTNLVSNSIKYTKEGSIILGADLLEKQNDTYKVRFYVSDTGIGIAKEDIPYIFDEFTQVDYHYTKKRNGTGLGLAITKKIADLLGGEIQVESAPDEGSCFSIILDLEEGEHKDKPLAANDEIGCIDINNNENFTILIAEDNHVNQIYIKHFLEKKNFITAVVANGKEAIDYYKEHQVNAILMDIQMPIMSGLDASIAIRKYEKELQLTEVPIIAVSASVSSGDKEKYSQLGINDVFLKPLQMSKVIEAIQDECSKIQVNSA